MTFTSPTIPLATYGEANIRLGKIEADENVTVVFAVESGSRAWGFPSPDSDNDVRFFYVRPLSAYLGLEEPRDVIERAPDGVWDVNGWDLRKTLQLLVKGNATASEWLSSPLIYREHGPLPYKLRDLIKRHSSPHASAKHYWGLTNTCYRGDVANRPTAIEMGVYEKAGTTIKGLTEVNYKKYFYAIRGACSIAWIVKYDEIPPMTLPALMSHDIMPDDTRTAVDRLLRLKAEQSEIGSGYRIPDLDSFIEAQLSWVREKGFDKIEVSADFRREANSLLLNALGV